jgi:hypothetical protein
VDIKDIAWAAGIYEGEGCFAGSSSTSRFVHVVQKDPWLCYKLKSLFGGSVHIYNGYHKWMLCGDGARGFLLTIFTFLSPRRRKVILEDKEFFRKLKCHNGLHDYIPLYTATERTPRGIREYCVLCRRAKQIRHSAARRMDRAALVAVK